MAKTETGIAITIRGFVPLDRGNLDGQIAALNAVKSATETKDLGALKDVMRVESVEAKQVSRRGEAEAGR